MNFYNRSGSFSYPEITQAEMGSKTVYYASRTNSHRTFDHHKCVKCKNSHKDGEIIRLFRQELWCTFTQMLNEKNI